MLEKNESHIECTLSDADLFTPSFVQTDVQHGIYEEIFPISKLDDNGPIEFTIENSTDKFIDAANTYLKMKLKIVKADGSNIPAEETVTPINYIFGSLFSQVDVKLGGCIISTSNNTYSYRAILETLLNYGKDAKKTQLEMGLYVKDQPERLDETDPARNVGLKERYEHFKESKTVEICGRIHSDLFHQGRLILNGLPLRITLNRNKSAFMLLADGVDPQYKMLVVESVLYVRKVQLTAHKFIEIQKNLEKVPALYPINRIDMRTHSVAAGLTSLNWDNVFQGQLPNRIFIGMVDNQSFTGHYKKSPFNFKHYSTSRIAVYVNGESLPGQPMKLDFQNNHYLDGYRSLFAATGKIGRDEGIDINMQDFKSGYTLFGFDVSPSICSGGHHEPIKRGSLRITLEFQIPLPNTITVIAYCEFDNVITVDKSRNVLKDY